MFSILFILFPYYEHSCQIKTQIEWRLLLFMDGTAKTFISKSTEPLPNDS